MNRRPGAPSWMWTSVCAPASALAAALAGGCIAPKGGGDAPKAAATQQEGPFAPVRMRLHPLTRWGRDSAGRPTIEVRLELFDRWGHGVKGLGSVWFGLTLGETGDISGKRQGREARESPGAELRWEVDLSDPEKNSLDYFDAVTRTYLVTLGLGSEVDTKRGATLRATFTTLDGKRLQADMKLE